MGFFCTNRETPGRPSTEIFHGGEAIPHSGAPPVEASDGGERLVKR